jgi:chromosome segregation ATPase
LNGEIDHDNYIDGDEGDSTKRSLIKILKLVLEVPDVVNELKTFFATIITINQEQNSLIEKEEKIKNKIKKVSINQKDLKQSLLVLSNKLINNEKDLRKKEDRRTDLQQLLIYIRETINNLNDISFQNKLISELNPQIKLSKNEIKDLEADIIELKNNVESKEGENNKIDIEVKRVQNSIEHEAISKQQELEKYEAENETLVDKIEEQSHFIKETKKEIFNATKYSEQLEKNILNKKSDLEDLNEEKVIVSGKYSKEEDLLKSQYDRLTKNVNQKKNQKIDESEKNKKYYHKNLFSKRKSYA